jgi:cephalosporin hydroxylase
MEQWRALKPMPRLRWSDLSRAPRRLKFTAALARAAVTDPSTFWIAATALRRHRALQKPFELLRYLQFVRRLRPARFLEIGTLWGGTFYAHCAVADPRAQAIAIEASPPEEASAMTRRFAALARSGQRVTCVWGDSHDPAVAAQVAAALGGETLDLLFLDGDHTSDGVRRDFETYGSLVKAGGVIAVHDIDGDGGVASFWRSQRDGRRVLEFVDRVHPPQGLGIGAIVKE